jgi:integrase
VADLSASGLAPATVAKAFHILSKIMAAAVDAGVIAQTPCRNIPLPRQERKEMRFLNPSEITALADAIEPRYRAFVLLAAYGGLRMGELTGLRRHRLDLLRGEVDVAEIAVEVNGHVMFGAPKTRAGRRRVGLPRSVVEELGDHLAGWSVPGSDLVFTNRTGGPLRASGFRRSFWTPAIRAAGLVPLRPHDLRHTAVALWIEAGADPKQVSVRAGHTSVAFTLDRYGHLYPEADERLRDRL